MQLKPLLPIGWLWLAGTLAVSAITATDLEKRLAQGEKLTVIDIRGPSLFAVGHIPGAINVPASICAQRKLPPIGKVVVCGQGLGRDETAAAAAALAAKPGLTVETLEGGFAAWESAHAQTTAPPGLTAETLNYISYADLKAAKADSIVLVDLRQPVAPTRQAAGRNGSQANQPVTDLAQEFPGKSVIRSPFDLPPSRQVAGKNPSSALLVLIDNGDGTAEDMARILKANSIKRYVILAGGERILARKGQPGLQRSGSASRFTRPRPLTPETTK